MSSRIDAARARARLAPLISYGSVAVALAVVVAFFIQAGLFESLLPKPAVIPPTVENPEQITSTDSTVNGLDHEKQPYEIKAVKAIQDKDSPHKVHLEQVTGSFHRLSGETIELAANTALYDTDTKLLDLAGSVTIVSKDRFTASMETAQVVTDEKKLTSSVPVTVQLPSGTINANGLEITDDGSRILFLNGVKARFTKAANKGDAGP